MDLDIALGRRCSLKSPSIISPQPHEEIVSPGVGAYKEGPLNRLPLEFVTPVTDLVSIAREDEAPPSSKVSHFIILRRWRGWNRIVLCIFRSIFENHYLISGAG